MNYTKDILNINEIEANFANAGSYTLGLDESNSWIDITEWSAETSTGIARSSRTGALYAFEITGRSVQRGVVRVAAYRLQDISLADGTLKADTTRRIGATVAAAFWTSPNYVERNSFPAHLDF